jgi:hypothetical protein
MEIGPEDGSESVDFGLENGVRKGPSSCGRRHRRRRAVCRSGEKRKMCADKAVKVRVKKRTFSKLKQLKSSALSFSPLLVCKLDEWGSETCVHWYCGSLLVCFGGCVCRLQDIKAI